MVPQQACIRPYLIPMRYCYWDSRQVASAIVSCTFELWEMGVFCARPEPSVLDSRQRLSWTREAGAGLGICRPRSTLLCAFSRGAGLPTLRTGGRANLTVPELDVAVILALTLHDDEALEDRGYGY